MSYSPPEVRLCRDVSDVALCAAELLANYCALSIALRGKFTLALSGGSTPLALFDLLGTPAWRSRLDWGRTQLFWADERCVPESHPASNSGIARRAFLESIPAALFPMYPDTLSDMPSGMLPVAAAAAYEDVLRKELIWEHLPGMKRPLPRFDCILLGMGNDGHTASLFPDTPEWDAERLGKPGDTCVAVTHVPRMNRQLPEAQRITLRLEVLNAARHCVFLVTGKSKFPVMSRILNPKASLEFPAQYIRPVHGELIWMVDKAASGQR